MIGYDICGICFSPPLSSTLFGKQPDEMLLCKYEGLSLRCCYVNGESEVQRTTGWSGLAISSLFYDKPVTYFLIFLRFG